MTGFIFSRQVLMPMINKAKDLNNETNLINYTNFQFL